MPARASRVMPMGDPHREAEAERRSDAHLAALIDQTIAGIAETDLTGRFLLVNDRYCKITGYPRDELLAGPRMQDITHADDLAGSLDLFGRLVADGTPFTIEKRYVRKDGGAAWVHNSVSAVRDDAGRIASVLAVVVDVSERKRAEAELRANEARLRALADVTASAIWTASPAGDVLDQSAVRWAFLTDLPAEELAAEWLAAVHPDDREPGNARWWAGIAAGQPFEFEQRVRQRDGAYRHFIVRAVPVRGEDEGIQEWVGADVDITHRKRAEAELRERDELLRLTLQAARAGAWVRDPATGREAWSREIFPLLGRHPGEIEPAFDSLLAVVHSDDREMLRTQAATDIPAGRDGQAEFRVVYPDESVHWILARGRTIIDAAGAPRRVGLMLDVTERMHAEEDLKRSEERYRTLFESVDQGFCIIEMIEDADGRAVDYRFEEVNPTFTRHTGLADAVGKTARALAPGLEDHWVEIYGEVAKTGERRQFELGSAAMGRWFEVEAVRIGGEGSRRVALLFSDITERRRTEEALREGARQDAFRAALTDALRPLTDPVAIQAEASRLLGEHLGVSRVVFGVAEADDKHVIVRGDYAVGLPSAAGRYRLEEFGAELAAAIRAGRTTAVDDVAAVPDLGMGERAAFTGLGVVAYAAVGLVKQGRLAALLAAGHASPRTWTASETALLAETAERTWAAAERAAAEAALRESERRLQSLADAMPQVVWAADPDGTVRYYNSRVAGFGGVAEPEPGVWVWQPTLHPDDLPATLEAWERAMRDASPYAQEHRILMADGEYRWHLSRAIPILDAAGRIDTWYGTATDIHDLKQAEIARRENEERLRVGIDVAGFALLEVDYDADVIHLSAEAARLYGLGNDAVTLPREQVHAAFHPDDRDALRRRIARAPGPDAAEPYTTEYRVLHPSGEVRWLSVRKQVMFERDGPSPRPARAILAALDITERKQAEADRQALLDALAHDLRNPLTVLRMQAQLLLRQFERGRMPERDVLAERVAGFLDLALRMTGLIDDLEEHAHLGIGGGAPDRQPTNLVALARDSVEELEQSTGTRVIRLESNEPELVGSWDPLHLRRVLDNLLGNAVKYSPAGSEVLVRLTRAGPYAVIEVRDEGIGIPASDLPHIFAFRHRGGNVGAVAGSGVGLAGVRQIVERHGGTVSVQSEEGRGSVFTVRLPLLISGR